MICPECGTEPYDNMDEYSIEKYGMCTDCKKQLDENCKTCSHNDECNHDANDCAHWTMVDASI